MADNKKNTNKRFLKKKDKTQKDKTKKIKIKKNKGFFQQKLSQTTRFLSRKFEDIFTNKKFTIIATFILSLILVQSVHAVGSVTFTKNNSSVVTGVELTADYDREKFVVEGLPETVNLILYGDEAAIQSTKNTKSYSVYVDLTTKVSGRHIVDVLVNNLPRNVSAQTDPNKIEVNIYTKEFKVFPVTPEIINTGAIEGLSMETPVLAESQISLKGAAKDLNRVSFVRALIDGKSINAALTDKEPRKFDGRASVVAYDESGNRVDNITVDTGGIDYTVDLVAPTGKPINSLTPIIVGNFPEGQAIKNFTLDTEAVTINGAESEVQKISSLDVQFDLKNVTGDTTVEGQVIIPEGVTLLSVSPKIVSAKIEFGPASSKVINIPSVLPIHADFDKYDYKVLLDEGSNLTLEVIGTAEQLALLDESQIKVEVDAAGLAEGTTPVSLSVNGPTIYRYKFNQPNVKLQITRK